MKKTVIEVSKETRERLKEHRHGNVNSYDQVINELIDYWDNTVKTWEEKQKWKCGRKNKND